MSHFDITTDIAHARVEQQTVTARLAASERATGATRTTDLERPSPERHHSLVDLVNAARAGDKNAWDTLVDRFLPLVTSVIAKHRLPPTDADDVNQTVWLRLVERLDDLREPLALPGWLATTARNESVRIIRLRGRLTPVDPQSAPWERAAPEPELDAELIRQERAIAFREALLELPPLRRKLLELLMADPPMSYDDISATLGIPKGSIGPTRARILEQLRTHQSIIRMASPC